MTKIIIDFLAGYWLKVAAGLAIAAIVSYGIHTYNEWIREPIRTEFKQHKTDQANAATESLRRNEIKANNTKDKYDKDLQNHRAAANGLDVVFERLRNTENPSNCDPAPADTARAADSPAPRFEW